VHGHYCRRFSVCLISGFVPKYQILGILRHSFFYQLILVFLNIFFIKRLTLTKSWYGMNLTVESSFILGLPLVTNAKHLGHSPLYIRANRWRISFCQNLLCFTF
jgi:hypothetical protein